MLAQDRPFISVEECRRTEVCMHCRLPARPDSPTVYDFGQTYGHKQCIFKANEKPVGGS